MPSTLEKISKLAEGSYGKLYTADPVNINSWYQMAFEMPESKELLKSSW